MTSFYIGFVEDAPQDEDWRSAMLSAKSKLENAMKAATLAGVSEATLLEDWKPLETQRREHRR